MKWSFFILCVYVFLNQPVHAQAQIVLQSKSSYSFPFILTHHNNIAVKVLLNEQDTINLMLHTATNAVYVTQEAGKRLSSLHYNGKEDSVKSWGGQSNESRYSDSNTLQIGDLKWTNISISEDINSGQNTDGKFGLNLFDNKVVEINFDESMITVSDNLPVKAKNYQQLQLTSKSDNLFIEGDCIVNKNIFHQQFLIHSGYAGTILLDDEFVNKNKIGEQLKISGEKDLKDSYGNVIKTKKAILPILKFGNKQFKDVTVGFFEGSIGRQKMSVLGGDILKRFNIIIDAKRDFIYLQPNKFYAAAFATF